MRVGEEQPAPGDRRRPEGPSGAQSGCSGPCFQNPSEAEEEADFGAGQHSFPQPTVRGQGWGGAWGFSGGMKGYFLSLLHTYPCHHDDLFFLAD